MNQILFKPSTRNHWGSVMKGRLFPAGKRPQYSYTCFFHHPAPDPIRLIQLQCSVAPSLPSSTMFTTSELNRIFTCNLITCVSPTELQTDSTELWCLFEVIYFRDWPALNCQKQAMDRMHKITMAAWRTSRIVLDSPSSPTWSSFSLAAMSFPQRPQPCGVRSVWWPAWP